MHTAVNSHAAASPPPDDERWSPRLILSLVSIVLVVELLTISYQMVSIGLPMMMDKFHTTQGAWLLTSFLLVGAVSAPILGKLADIHGKRRILLIVVGISAAGSLVAALAPNYEVLVAARAVQGVLVGSLFLSYSLIRDVYPPGKVALSVSVTTAGMGVISIPSPWLTGWLLDTWGFRSIFWFLFLCLAVLGVLIALTTDESSVRLRSRIDFLGAVLLGAGLAAVLIGVSFGPTWGWTATGTLGSIVGGVLLLAAWAWTSRYIREPLVDLRFFTRRPIILTAAGAGLSMGAITVFNVMLPLMCMTPAVLGMGYGFGVDAKGFAIYQAPMSVLMVIGGLIVGRTVNRVHPRPLMIGGMALLTLGPLLVAMSHDNKALVIAFTLIQGLGMGLAVAAVPNLVIAAVPAKLQATTASLVGVFQSGISAVLPVVVFAVLNSHIGKVVAGNVFYSDSGIRMGFLIGALTALIGVATALGLPRRAARIDVPAVTDEDPDPALVTT